jgi:hypothetical protein
MLHDPQAPFGRFGCEQSKCPSLQSERIFNALRRRAEHPDTGIVRRRIEANVGEVQIKSDQYPLLIATYIKESSVGATNKTLIEYGLNIVPRVA